MFGLITCEDREIKIISFKIYIVFLFCLLETFRREALCILPGVGHLTHVSPGCNIYVVFL